MKMRMPKLTKAEKIMALLNQWDPMHGADRDFRFYQVEASIEWSAVLNWMMSIVES